MLKYLVILLDDRATSYCHYDSRRTSPKLISATDLRDGIIWAMKENLMIQFVYPDAALPKEYCDLIDSVDHIDIKPNDIKAEVSIFNGMDEISSEITESGHPIILRLSKDELFNNIDAVKEMNNVNIVLTDVDSFSEVDLKAYKKLLGELKGNAIKKIRERTSVHVNILTDRIQLSSMNNCGAGVESVTLAPDGQFYICPAFYFDDECNVGNPKEGLRIPNQQLYKLEYAPICKKCDAYQCRRCVWLNKKMTLEVNTPSHEQCVLSHLERNASRELLESLKEQGLVKTDLKISEIDYLDPFYTVVK